ncbi:MFS transporter [Spirochaetia bacterium]|nr:MFS transporter [Spirochaetia bacterium]GHU36761.1 MFS transporter [Spirochaetia bacterium]
MNKNRSGFGAYMGLTFLIGCGFFTMGLMDPLYDTYVPLFLRRYIHSNAAVGGIMTLDNLLQLLLIPVVSIWSDRTRTRIGRRMPFIVVMLPISAILFALIPSMAARSLAALIIIIFFFNIFKTSVRGPVVALMPDTIPGEFRSEANGVINMMAGIGLIIGTLVLAQLMKINDNVPFFAAGICIFIAVAILLIFVRERLPEGEEVEKNVPVFQSIKEVFSTGDSSVPRILISLFFWFMAYEGAKPFLGLYLVESMGADESNAALAQGMAGISSVIMAVPAGYLAHKFGRRRFIRVSLIFCALILFLIPVVGLVAARLSLSSALSLILFLLLMFLYGAVWIGIVVNSFPMLWQMASFGTIGVYTGLYYTFSQSAAILAPPVTGAIIDLGGYPGIFIFGGICMLIAWFTMGGVKSGEVSQTFEILEKDI